jgi:hypothetical protein
MADDREELRLRQEEIKERLRILRRKEEIRKRLAEIEANSQPLEEPGFMDNMSSAVQNIAQSIGTGQVLPGIDEVIGTGGALAKDVGERTLSGVSDKVPLTPFESEGAPSHLMSGLRMLTNLLVPEKLPTGEQVSEKTGETISSVAPTNILNALPKLMEAPFTPEGRKGLGHAAIETVDMGKRIEEGDLLGLAADIATSNPLRNTLLNPVKAGIRSTTRAAKIVKGTGDAVVNFFNNKAFAGGAKVAKKEIVEIMSNPKSVERFNASSRGEIDPFIVAKEAHTVMTKAIQDRANKYRGDFANTVDTSIEVPGSATFVESLVRGLEDFGVKLDPNTNLWDHSSFRGRLEPTDIDAADILLREFKKIDANPTLENLRESMLALDNQLKNKDYLASDLRQTITGGAVSKMRDKLNSISPELKKVNEQYALDSTELSEFKNLFSVVQGQTKETTISNMMKAFSDKPFAKKRLELLKNAEQFADAPIIPAILGNIAASWTPSGVIPAVLSTAQFVGAAGLALGGLPAGAIAAIAGLPMMSPKLIANIAKAKGWVKNATQEAALVTGLQKVYDALPDNAITQGLTIGSALERFQERTEDTLTTIGGIGR